MEDKFVDSKETVVEDITALATILITALVGHPHRDELVEMVEMETGAELKDWTNEDFVRSYLEKYLLS